MDLLNAVDAAYQRRSVDEVIRHEVRSLGAQPQLLRLGGHAFTQLAYCIEHGNRAECRYAIGLRTVWGRRLKDLGALLG